MKEFRFKFLSSCLSFFQVEDADSQLTVSCPDDITVIVSDQETTKVVSWDEPVAVDNNDRVRRTWRSHAPGFAFPVGQTVVTYSWIDPRNDTGTLTCTFHVIVSTQGMFVFLAYTHCINEVLLSHMSCITPVTRIWGHQQVDEYSTRFCVCSYCTPWFISSRLNCNIHGDLINPNPPGLVQNRIKIGGFGTVRWVSMFSAQKTVLHACVSICKYTVNSYVVNFFFCWGCTGFHRLGVREYELSNLIKCVIEKKLFQ